MMTVMLSPWLLHISFKVAKETIFVETYHKLLTWSVCYLSSLNRLPWVLDSSGDSALWGCMHALMQHRTHSSPSHAVARPCTTEALARPLFVRWSNYLTTRSLFPCSAWYLILDTWPLQPQAFICVYIEKALHKPQGKPSSVACLWKNHNKHLRMASTRVNICDVFSFSASEQIRGLQCSMQLKLLHQWWSSS